MNAKQKGEMERLIIIFMSLCDKISVVSLLYQFHCIVGGTGWFFDWFLKVSFCVLGFK